MEKYSGIMEWKKLYTKPVLGKMTLLLLLLDMLLRANPSVPIENN